MFTCFRDFEKSPELPAAWFSSTSGCRTNQILDLPLIHCHPFSLSPPALYSEEQHILAVPFSAYQQGGVLASSPMLSARRFPTLKHGECKEMTAEHGPFHKATSSSQGSPKSNMENIPGALISDNLWGQAWPPIPHPSSIAVFKVWSSQAKGPFPTSQPVATPSISSPGILPRYP